MSAGSTPPLGSPTDRLRPEEILSQARDEIKEIAAERKRQIGLERTAQRERHLHEREVLVERVGAYENAIEARLDVSRRELAEAKAQAKAEQEEFERHLAERERQFQATLPESNTTPPQATTTTRTARQKRGGFGSNCGNFPSG